MDLQGLDHVAIAVRDLSRSVDWYGDVLGLERRYEDAWGGEPPFMMCAGSSCIALFPVEGEPRDVGGRDAVAMRHFAFATDRRGFEEAREELKQRNISFELADHIVCHSIYLLDPDGHSIEIATYEIP